MQTIASIEVVDRHRKDMGDLQSLAASIDQLGLLQPVLIGADNRLIAGGRRLEAARSLGWESIPVYVIDSLTEAATRLRAERDENTERKAMTPSELVSLARAIEEVEAPKAKERMAEAGRSAAPGRPAERSADDGGPLPRTRHETREVVAEAVGIGRTNLGYAKKIVARAEQGDPAAIAAKEHMDTTGKVMPAYEQMIGRRVSHRERADPNHVPNRAKRADRVQQITDMAEQGYSSRQISERLGVRDDHVRKMARDEGITIQADKAIGRTRRHDSNRIVTETVNSLAGLSMGVDLINYDDLDMGQVPHWAISLNESFRTLNRFRKQIKEMTQ